MAATEKLEKEVLAHAEIAIRLEESGVLSTRAMKKLSEKHKLIQEQSRVIVEKEKESKDYKEKEKNSTKLLAAAENLHKTLSTFAMNKLSEKEKIIQEQAKQIEEKEK